MSCPAEILAAANAARPPGVWRGLCYRASAKMMLALADPTDWWLVHGTLRHPGPHAWVEHQKRFVFDPVIDRAWGMLWDSYAKATGAERWASYSAAGAYHQLRRHRHFGPWPARMRGGSLEEQPSPHVWKAGPGGVRAWAG